MNSPTPETMLAVSASETHPTGKRKLNDISDMDPDQRPATRARLSGETEKTPDPEKGASQTESNDSETDSDDDSDDDMDIDLDVRSYRSREASEHPFAADADLDLGLGAGLGDLDLGISFDGLPDEGERTPRLTPSRACEFHLVFDPIRCLMIFD